MPLPFRFRAVLWSLLALAVLAGLAAVIWEARTSTLQARLFTHYAAGMTFALEPGINPALRVPETGPYNQRFGYTLMPHFVKALEGEGFDVAWQMRTSQGLDAFVDEGGFSIYRAKDAGGLTLYDRDGMIMHQAVYPTRTFKDFDDIPPLLVQSLLYIEDRDVLDAPVASYNPAVDWARMLQALGGQVLARLLPGAGSGGGSTLAIQTEKFRHSEGGQTNGPLDKLRQMIAASLRAYLDGPDTRERRKEIVLSYLNATPLAARPGWGEINGIGDGLWAWFNIDLDEAKRALQSEETPALLPWKARIYKHVLALVLAQRRPAYYLQSKTEPLEQLANATLARLLAADIISPALARAAQSEPLALAATAPPVPQPSFIAQKATNAIRYYLSSNLDINNLYDLDHIDAAVGTTLDGKVQGAVTHFLQQLHDPAFIAESGLQGERLLSEGNDPSKINWTIILYERTPQGNALRVQADNLEQPLDLNDGAKLDLGSTAKLRTLTTYLEIMDELHHRLAPLENEALNEIMDGKPDNLTSWAIGWMKKNPDRELEPLLQAAMQRQYSANPHEAFFTDGGMLTFGNFDAKDNGRIVTLTEALRKSINLPFIRLMRDIVNYEMAQGPNPRREVLGDRDHPARMAYLERFAEQEGAVYLSGFYEKYRTLSREEAAARLMRQGQKRSHAMAAIFRSLLPEASADDFVRYVRQLRPKHPSNDMVLRKNFAAYPKERFNLADRAYVAGVHPLELWLVEFLVHHPKATKAEALAASRSERVASYAWLFKTGKAAQDTRIRLLQEKDAFAAIHARWARLGYPFEKLVPSLATAVGSSADRPGALAELMGIILNEGVRLPMVRANFVNFAMGTPYQTMMARQPPIGKMAMNPVVARVLRLALREVVSDGTAKRVEGAFTDANGKPLPIGGKTGTGDHRYETYGPGGAVTSSRVVNRTATFVFYIGDRFFGSITAYVAGEQAAKYRFTSALPSQMLKILAPQLTPLLQHNLAGANK